MKRKFPYIILIVSIFINIALIFYIFKNYRNLNIEGKPLTNDSKESESFTENPYRTITFTDENNPIFLRGQVRKEPIPTELELGDFWYWIYFDKPYLLIYNASGVPMYIDKIQAVPSGNRDFYDIEKFLNKEVEIHGFQGWGYAESSVFNIMAIREY
jgi:hypothetical protein